MTDNENSYYEVCITLDSRLAKQLKDVYISAIMDFSGEAVEIADSKIIIRTSKNRQFVDALLAHIRNLNDNLYEIWKKRITTTSTIEIKQNKDWIAEYKRGVKPLKCGRFYIYPPWEKPSCNLSLMQSLWEPKKSSIDIPSVLPHSNAFAQPINLVQDTKIANSTELLLRKLPPKQPKKLWWKLCGFYNFLRTSLDLKYVNLLKIYKSTQNVLKGKIKSTEIINIVLEPSLAFGTGHHVSTYMCIESLQSLDAQEMLKNKNLLDFGCGSGILALCAHKMGANVDLCDIDENAIVESKKNFNNNNATISHIWQGGIADKIAKKGAKSGIYDIIVANIIASVLIEQKDNIDSSLKCGGIVVLSGILDIYKDEVLARFAGFTPLAIRQKDEWICAILQKNRKNIA